MAYEKPTEDPIVYTHRDFGSAFFERNVPNATERMFMVCRAINFDLGNYNKLYSSPDVSQRRRYMKNVFRLLDHPTSYIFWKTLPYFQSGKLRFLPVYWGLMYSFAFWTAGKEFAKAAHLAAMEKTLEGHTMHEEVLEEFTNDRMSSMFFHETEGNAGKGLMSSKNYPPLAIFCRLNTHVRDQNLRKYFAHRERRGANLFTGKPLA